MESSGNGGLTLFNKPLPLQRKQLKDRVRHRIFIIRPARGEGRRVLDDWVSIPHSETVSSALHHFDVVHSVSEHHRFFRGDL